MSAIHVGKGEYVELGDSLTLKGLCETCTAGVFRPVSAPVAQAQNARRAEAWCAVFAQDDANGFPRTSEFERKNPLFGAFGEKIG